MNEPMRRALMVDEVFVMEMRMMGVVVGVVAASLRDEVARIF